MIATLTICIPSLILVHTRNKILDLHSSKKQIVATYLFSVIALNWLMTLILRFGFNNRGELFSNLNTYPVFTFKYMALAVFLSLAEPFAEKFIRQNKYIIKIFNYRYTIYVITAAAAFLVFCSIYGIHVLNPTYTDWLMSGGDLTQHYLGWKAYRNSSWHFPIGMTDTLAYPYLTSVIFTDSIPLFAVFFKILSPILPAEFQYFGFYGLLCFILQAVLAVRIIRNFTPPRTQACADFIRRPVCLYTSVDMQRVCRNFVGKPMDYTAWSGTDICV